MRPTKPKLKTSQNLDLPLSLETQDYADTYKIPAFKSYSKTPYFLTIDLDNVELSDSKSALLIGSDDMNGAWDKTKAIFCSPMVKGFSFCGIDSPFIVETYDSELNSVSVVFSYIDDADGIIAINEALHPEIYKQLTLQYENALLLKNKEISSHVNK